MVASNRNLLFQILKMDGIVIYIIFCSKLGIPWTLYIRYMFLCEILHLKCIEILDSGIGFATFGEEVVVSHVPFSVHRRLGFA